MAKKVDINGFWTIKSNPITKEGVFPYSGSQIDFDSSLGLEPNKIYNVYRPASELTKDETMESFNGDPLIEEHEMLGDGCTKYDDRPASGVMFNVAPNDNGDGLNADLKIYSEDVKESIEGGKKELSLGYRCRYESKRGVFRGETYDFVQKDISGNHIALVDKGRMGSEVRVYDSKALVFDSIDAVNQIQKGEDAMDGDVYFVFDSFSESDHPRDNEGKFGSGGGSEEPVTVSEKTKNPKEYSIPKGPKDKETTVGSKSKPDIYYAQISGKRKEGSLKDIQTWWNALKKSDEYGPLKGKKLEITQASGLRGSRPVYEDHEKNTTTHVVGEDQIGEDAMTDEEKAAEKLASVSKALDGIVSDEEMEVVKDALTPKPAKDMEPEGKKTKEEKPIKKTEDMEPDEKPEEKKAQTAEDVFPELAAMMAARNDLVEKVTPLIGAFDSAVMTPAKAAVYACGKLGLICDEADALPTLNGFLAGHKPAGQFTMDAATKPGPDAGLQKYLEEGE